MGAVEAEGCLTRPAVAKGGSASTQNQAKSAVLFLYKGKGAVDCCPALAHFRHEQVPGVALAAPVVQGLR